VKSKHKKRVSSRPDAPQYADILIDKLKRKKDWESALDARNQLFAGPIPSATAGPSGLSSSELYFLRQHVLQNFQRRARLSIGEIELLDRHLKPVPLDRFATERLVFEHARTYKTAVEEAVSELTDLVTHAALARKRRRVLKDRDRVAIWMEAISFSELLTRPEVWGKWCDRAGVPAHAQPAFGEPERQSFWKLLLMHRSDWLSEADRRIDLRGLLSGVRDRARRLDPLHKSIARLMFALGDPTRSRRESGGRLEAAVSDLDICREMDSQNERALSESRSLPFPVPAFLERMQIRLWAGPFQDKNLLLTQRLYEFLSKIRREFGLRLPRRSK
jgi:hypothetical protein